MLILHQTGSVKVGEVVRYTLTYTPSADRILPAPSQLHVKIKNTSAIPLRAAYLHGPYTLYVACYPSTFDPNQKQLRTKEEGTPEFEPNLKAGGHWTSKLTVPEEIRQAAGGPQSRRSLEGDSRSVTWIIEVASQVIFSTSASVHYELLVGRDERSVELGFHGIVGSGQGVPGRLEDHQESRRRNVAQAKGVFSKAVTLAVHDTESLWNMPPFPQWTDEGSVMTEHGPRHGDKTHFATKDDKKTRKQQKIHLVVLTHGLHSNLGADMLYLKESIDTAARQACEDSKKRKAVLRKKKLEEQNQFGRDVTDDKTKSTPEIAIAPTEPLTAEEEDDQDEEQVIVRGFGGNAVKTERGIQYLGKRLAKYVLSITYPDQPYLPVKSSISKSIIRPFTSGKTSAGEVKPAHRHSSIVKDEEHTNHNLAYRITSISFIAHSLGGLIQTYAIAYIQKHSPEFFDRITPINFVAMASPFLGLSNENPIYVKFALDFGLVGRTGQDLGLTWRTPTIARSGWEAVIGGLGQEARKTSSNQPDPGTKPLLRILPTGPAQIALKRFRNRSVYSNVVNDGIVPLRTSCLLFLDWRGLDRVEKARRENGLVGTMVGWGWAEMTGQNASAPRKALWNEIFGDSDNDSKSPRRRSKPDEGDKVPQPDAGDSLDDEGLSGSTQRQLTIENSLQDETWEQTSSKDPSAQQSSNLWSGLVSFFKPQTQKKATHHTPKHQKIYRRGQITHNHNEDSGSMEEESVTDGDRPRRGLVRGSSLYTNGSGNEELEAPPKTTFFESAGDLLNPPLPPKEFLIDPAARPRTIFHDRVYHPEDIPPPPAKRPRTFIRRLSSKEDTVTMKGITDTSRISNTDLEIVEAGGMKIEEKIARAYHKDLSWRKVLVRLEPDAHNNMIVRRMFANAYGWPVIKHLCDTHFAFTAAAQLPDHEESSTDRAEKAEVNAGEGGEEVIGQLDPPEESKGPNKAEEGRPRSFDNAKVSHSAAGKFDNLAHKLQELDPKGKAPVRRTDSEKSEYQDKVSDLVSNANATGESSYSSMNSAKPSLTKISREDSAKWTDRFFEGSEDGSDDEAYLIEWQKAKARGEGFGNRTSSDPKMARAKIAGTLTESPQATLVKAKKDDGSSPAAETSLKEPVPKFLKDGALTSEPEQTMEQDAAQIDPMILSLTGIGLQKTAEEQLSPKLERGRSSLGFSEQVARAASSKNGRQSETD